MSKQAIKSDIFLLITAIIWGFAFVAQREGMNHVGPFIFNALRFALGCFVLGPIIILARNRDSLKYRNTGRITLTGGVIAGFFLFIASTLQQIGLINTTAGKAGFITGLYVILVPIFGYFFQHRIGLRTAAGAVFAAVGLFFLSINENFSVNPGDTLVLIGAFIWAIHVLIIGKYSPHVNPFHLAFIQFGVCSLLSTIVSIFVEEFSLGKINDALIPVLYAGLVSVGIAYTLQVVAQKHAPPAHASIIMSLESVFAAVGGYLILSENFTLRQYLGCAMMLLGMFLSEVEQKNRSEVISNPRVRS